jgi:hypothetical protein
MTPASRAIDKISAFIFSPLLLWFYDLLQAGPAGVFDGVAQSAGGIGEDQIAGLVEYCDFVVLAYPPLAAIVVESDGQQ